MRNTALLSLLALLLVGCSGNKQVAQNPPSTPPETLEPPKVEETPKPVDSPNPAKTNEPAAKPASLPWKETKETEAVEIAKKTDAMIKSLSSVQADAQMEVTIPEGVVQVNAGAKIKDSKTFYIQYPYIPKRIPMIAVIKSNGQKVGELREGKPVAPGTVVKGTPKEQGWDIAPVGKLPHYVVGVSPLRVREIPRMVFAGLADGSSPFTEFVRDLEKGGFKVRVEKRITPVGNTQVMNYRILGDKGNEKVEIVVDGKLYLPVTINATSDKVGGKVESLRWSTRWQNKVTFDPKEFAIQL